MHLCLGTDQLQNHLRIPYLFHKKLYGKELSKLESETASELGWDWYDYPFKLWYREMNGWLGSSNG